MLERIVPVNFIVVRVVTAIAIGVAVAAAFGERLYAGDQHFTDIVAGEVAFYALHKAGDYRLVALFLVVTSIAYVALGVVPRLRPNRQSPPPGSPEHLLVLLLPLVAAGLLLLRWLAAEFRPPSLGLPLAAGCSLVVAGVATHRLMGPDSNDRRGCVQRIVMALLTPTFLFVSMVGVLIFLSAIFLVRTPRVLIADHADEITYTFLVAGTVLAVIAAADRVRLQNLFRWTLKSQLLVPLVLLWPLVGVYEHRGSVFQANVTGLARVLGALVVAGAIISSWRAIQRRLKKEASVRAAILPWTVVSIAVLTVSGTPPPSAFSLGDDFHTGELAIQWQQLTAFEHEAFASFVPIPGLIGGFIGGVNDFLFAGTVTSWPLAVAFTDALIAAVTAVVITRLVGPPVALLLSTTMVVSNLLLPGNRTVFLVLPLAVLALPGLVRRPLLWLGVWTTIAAFGTAMVSSTGLALTLATAPIAVWVAGAWLRGLTRRVSFTSREAAGLGTLLIVAVAIMAFLPNLLSMAEFLREGARSNLAAYGIGLFQFPIVLGLPESMPLVLRRSIWETVRLGAWIIGLPVLLALIHVAAKRGGLISGRRGPTPLAVFGIGLGGFFLASIPYAFGRIDPGTLSRPGSLSVMFFAVFLPITLMLAGRQLRPAIPLVMSVAWGLAIWGAFFSLRPSDLIRQAALPIRAMEPSHFVDGFEPNAPSLGRGLVADEDLRRLRDLSRVLRATLRPGETYYDATNRSLHYFSLGRRIPTPFSGPFYAVDEWSQNQVVEALERDPPPVVWVGPTFFTGPNVVPSNLRAYRIYRWLLDEARYIPVRIGGMEFLIFGDRAQNLPPGAERFSDPAALPSLQLGDVAAVPVSWGRSFDSLSFRFGPEFPLEQAPDPRPGVAAWLLPDNGSGDRYDFLLVEIICSTGSDKLMLARAEWDSYDGTHQLLMEAGHGRILVPLGGDPSWLLYGATGTVRIGISPEPHCGDASFGEASLLRLER